MTTVQELQKMLSQKRDKPRHESISMLRKLHRNEPDNAVVKAFLGQALMEMHTDLRSEATRLCAEAIDAGYDVPEVYFTWSRALMKEDRMDEALDKIQEMFALLAESRKHDGVLMWPVVNATEKEEVQNTMMYAQHGHTLVQQIFYFQRLPSESIQIGETAQHMNPEDGRVYYYMGLAYDMLKQHAKASKMLRRAAILGANMLPVIESARPYARRLTGVGGPAFVDVSGRRVPTVRSPKMRPKSDYPKEVGDVPPMAIAVGAGDNNGGWSRRMSKVVPRSVSGKGSKDVCDIDRRDVSKLTIEQFEKEYVNRGRPVILRGLMDGWVAWKRWTRDGLLRKFGDVVVQARRSSAVSGYQVFESEEDTVGQGVSSADDGVELGDMTLDRFVELYMPSVDDDDKSRAVDTNAPYVFLPRKLPNLSRLFKHPAHFNNFAWTESKRNKQALFYLGPANSGAYFHSHTTAWNALVYGKKRWFLFPPELYHGRSYGLSMPEWISQVRNELPVTALECTQHAGEIVYVPSRWRHGVLNLQDSVGLAVEIGDSNDSVDKAKRFQALVDTEMKEIDREYDIAEAARLKRLEEEQHQHDEL
eukprot:TRINITY_DN84722_c0_g1_i1.p1 TRINITY_DN84722_c0_g1~~TRINITY_DN84722_c0_g1_i1.p1  ORF type:complete len:654 (-),score=300.52 TRINITY_DN84722_c0_g1_i1:25-1791(-)